MRQHLLAGAAVCALWLGFGGAAAAQAPSASAAEVEELVVFGGGEARQVQTVDAQEMIYEAPGASPLKLVEKLPNVNFQASDPFGAYEWAARITIRGFGQNQLGFVLDDVPLGDMSYGAHNGLHISRAIASENVGRVELAQGAGALETASSNNLGGTLKFVSRDPAAEFGGLAALTYGSENTLRGFLRLDSGELPTGARGYLSYSNNAADKWKGDGEQKQQQVNFKLVQPVGEGRITGWVNWSKRRENDYQDLSLGMIERLGSDWDNISDNWDLAVRLAEIGNNRGDTGVAPRFPSFGTVYPAPIATVDDAYYDAAGLRDDVLGAITLDYPVGEALDIRATVYGHDNKGQGLWYTPYVASPNYGVAGATTDNAPISIRTTEYDIERYGVVAGATWRIGDHAVNAGLWYEDNSFLQARRFYALNRDRTQRDSLKMQSNPFATQWAYDFDTTTWQFHVQDTWRVNEALTINAGFKSLSVENSARTITGPNKTGEIEAKEGFLPQAGFKYATEMGEVFGAYSRNMRAFPSSATTGPFSASQSGFLAIKDELKPEISDTVEIGYRFRNDSGVQGVAAFYYAHFKDRLFAVPVGSGIVGNPTALSNVGGVEVMGIETAVDWTFADHWTVFGSYAYNDSEYEDDTYDGDGVLIARTAGKAVVDTPEHLLKGELGYDDGAVFARVSASYMSRRFFTYENDQAVEPQTLVDLTAGYRFSGSPLLEGLEVQVNVSNLFDEDYISTINSNGSPLRGDSQTLLVGSPRQAFVTVRKVF